MLSSVVRVANALHPQTHGLCGGLVLSPGKAREGRFERTGTPLGGTVEVHSQDWLCHIILRRNG